MKNIMVTVVVLVALIGIEAQGFITDAYNNKQKQQDTLRIRARAKGRSRKQDGECVILLNIKGICE